MKRRSLLILAVAAASATLALGRAAAQNEAGGAGAAGEHPVAITGATVHTAGAAGTLRGATVLIAGGRIQAVGVGIAIPAGARRIDAAGKVVTPGLMDSLTSLGLVEVGFGAGTNDATNHDPSLSAAFDVSVAINAGSMLLPVNRVEGITRAISGPAGDAKNLFLGQVAAIDLAGPHRTVVIPAVGQLAVFGDPGDDGPSRVSVLLKLRHAIEDAADYDLHRQAYDQAQRRPYSVSKADLDALVPVARGRQPLVVGVNRASDIEALLGLARDLKLKLILAGAAEGWKVAGEIAAAHVPVLVNPLDNLPEFDSLGATLENAARLARAGVTIALFTNDSDNARNLRQEAGNAVAYGLPWDTALAAMTANPAAIWGLRDYGTIEPGKDADLVVWDGDPLELTTAAQHVFIRGVEMPQDSRQLRLRDRYLHRAGAVPPPA